MWLPSEHGRGEVSLQREGHLGPGAGAGSRNSQRLTAEVRQSGGVSDTHPWLMGRRNWENSRPGDVLMSVTS